MRDRASGTQHDTSARRRAKRGATQASAEDESLGLADRDPRRQVAGRLAAAHAPFTYVAWLLYAETMSSEQHDDGQNGQQNQRDQPGANGRGHLRSGMNVRRGVPFRRRHRRTGTNRMRRHLEAPNLHVQNPPPREMCHRILFVTPIITVGGCQGKSAGIPSHPKPRAGRIGQQAISLPVVAAC
jgi:hypothetical protein